MQNPVSCLAHSDDIFRLKEWFENLFIIFLGSTRYIRAENDSEQEFIPWVYCPDDTFGNFLMLVE